MAIDYEQLAERAVSYGKQVGVSLDYTLDSLPYADMILDVYHKKLKQYDSNEGKETLWNIAVHFGIYLGETMLRVQLREQGFGWYLDEGMPVLQNCENIQLSPVTKAHKRILYGAGDSIVSFCKVALEIANGRLPRQNVRRVIDMALSSGEKYGNVLQRELGSFIDAVSAGKEKSISLRSQDGILKFSGFGDQFTMEAWINGRHYVLLNPDRPNATKKTRLITPYGVDSAPAREVLTLAQVKANIRAYYEQIDGESFLNAVSTEEVAVSTGQAGEKFQF